MLKHIQKQCQNRYRKNHQPVFFLWINKYEFIVKASLRDGLAGFVRERKKGTTRHQQLYLNLSHN